MDDTQSQNIIEPTPEPVRELIDLEKLILSHTEKIDRLQENLRKINEMVNNILENDPTYREHMAAAKEANRVKNATKQQILTDPTAANTVSKMNDAREQIKELRKSLSNYLQEYVKKADTNQIEDLEGGIREIIYTARLVRRGTKFAP